MSSPESKCGPPLRLALAEFEFKFGERANANLGAAADVGARAQLTWRLIELTCARHSTAAGRQISSDERRRLNQLR